MAKGDEDKGHVGCWWGKARSRLFDAIEIADGGCGFRGLYRSSCVGGTIVTVLTRIEWWATGRCCHSKWNEREDCDED
jgi:hypothetical protein